MKLTVESRAPRQTAPWTRVHFVTRDERSRVLPGVSEKEFSARASATLNDLSGRTLYVGLGEEGKVTASTLRLAAGAAVLALKKIGRLHAALELGNWGAHAESVALGAVLADYRFDRYASKSAESVEQITLHVSAAQLRAARAAARRGELIATATNEVRAIGNLPGNVIYPETLAAHALKLSRSAGLRATVLSERQLRRGGFGGILAVGQGSARPPRFIVLEHRGGPRQQRPIALVGKAITFDTGGISIKPAANMEDMIFDKSGGIAVLGAMAALARLKVKRNVVGLIACAENMPGPAAYRPGDIVTTLDGKHVEIVNTDAEGRVVLADAIAYARRQCRAAAIVDLATLTGACVVALGEYAAGLFANDEPLRAQISAAAEKVGERVWSLPIFPEHEEQIASDVALIKNSGGRHGGASTGAAFLKTFAEDTPWVHLDIAPVAHSGKERNGLARGATGFGVRTLVEFVERFGA